MSRRSGHKPSKRRALIGLVALCLGALAPLATGAIGFWQYYSQGYFVTKTGDLVSGPMAVLGSSIFVLAGFGMIAVAIWLYRRKSG